MSRWPVPAATPGHLSACPHPGAAADLAAHLAMRPRPAVSLVGRCANKDAVHRPPARPPAHLALGLPIKRPPLGSVVLPRASLASRSAECPDVLLRLRAGFRCVAHAYSRDIRGTSKPPPPSPPPLRGTYLGSTPQLPNS